MNESITWFSVSSEMPDADETVLCCWKDADVWLGYTDGEHWFAPDGFPTTQPIFWARLPEGPV